MANQISNFVKLAIALITGDDAKATALKIQKKGSAALAAQIAVKNAHTLNLEEALETAQEDLVKARLNNGELISNTDTYISNILSANRRVKKCQEELDNHLSVIEFLKTELELIKS